MRIFITGGTGLIGKPLCQRLQTLHHELTVLTRDPQKGRERLGDNVSYVTSLDALSNLDGYDAVINLAGEPIADKRWSEEQKQRLCHSRWDITQRIVELIHNSTKPPSVLLSGSAVGYYGDQDEALVTEEDPPHHEFTHDLCARWEGLALQAASDKTRVCLMRTGIVLSPNGGALSKMLPLFRLGLGGEMGSGRQYMPWIHIDDMVNAILYLLECPTLNGPFNMTAPYPVHNEQFIATLGEILGRPTVVRTPAFAIKTLMGEASVLVLTGQRAVPKRLEEAGFGFRYFELEDALRNVLGKEF
ncbi:TIGR01777 family oxidoreductase [Hafnia paralvei]|uniref:TIGR01777 family oxidoreductase n=1 Tax=Hafnia paralvei TaxID=546367 RepID=UPI0018F0B0A5|nr:TIGR01777 family oxidoreductase [Hafnia paralvei]MBW2957004.1 TIGR01777 family oxidoreductase [Hafnia paralvei]MCQ4168793.1 TIGR01777 family oxidoreductase [Hafnia paralvei]